MLNQNIGLIRTNFTEIVWPHSVAKTQPNRGLNPVIPYVCPLNSIARPPTIPIHSIDRSPSIFMHFMDLVSISLRSLLMHFVYRISISLVTPLLLREIWLVRSNGTSRPLDLRGPPCAAYQKQGADDYANDNARYGVCWRPATARGRYCNGRRR